MRNMCIAGAALLSISMTQATAASVLYANKGTDSGLGVVSQNESAAADDFTVPEGRTWTIKEVDVTGVYFNGAGPADSETVTFYKAVKGGVGKAVASYPGRIGIEDGYGSFRISIPKTKLKSGTYFVSVVINMPFEEGGEWHWENMLQVHGNAPEWEDPTGGGDCQTWTLETTCFGPGIGDHFFKLRGRTS